MIYIEGKTYANVWKVTPTEKYIDLQVSTCDKNSNGDKEYSSWFPRCVGKAFNAIKGVEKGDTIIIKKAKITNPGVKQEDGKTRSYFHFTVFDAELVKDDGTRTHSATPKPSKPVEKAKVVEDDNGVDVPW